MRFSARSVIYTLPKTVEGILSLKPADLRDRHLVRIETNVLDRITIEAPGNPSTILARKVQPWPHATLARRPLNPDAVTRTLDTSQTQHARDLV